MQVSLNDLSEVVETLRGPSAPAPGGGHEKRRAVRVNLQARVTVAPLINGRVGTAFGDLTSDISPTGLGLVQSIPMAREQHLVVRLPRKNKKPLYVLTWVMHCRPLAHGLFGVGVEFRDTMSVDEHDMVEPEREEHGDEGQARHDLNALEEFILN